MKPPFGTLNARLSKTLVDTAPKYRKIVEPFGDGGTWALELKKRRPKEHILNIVDIDLFAAMSFIQNPSAADKARLKSFDWVASQETFDKVVVITATEGPEHFYKFLYLKKFGMSMKPGEPPTFDFLSVGKDISPLLFALPLMKIGFKGVTILNDDPMAVLGSASGADTFLILLPKSPEDVDAIRSRLSGLSASVFFAAKVPSVEQALEWAKAFPDQTAVITVPSIMMNKMAVVTNYENKLVPLVEPGNEGKMAMQRHVHAMRLPRARVERRAIQRLEIGASYKVLFEEAASRTLRREEADVMRTAKKLMERRDLSAFYDWLRAFYGEHLEFTKRQFAAVVQSYNSQIARSAADEINMTDIPEMAEFNNGYTENLAFEWTMTSDNRLRAVLAKASEEGTDPTEALQGQFDTWREDRPRQAADHHIVEAGGAVAKFVFAAGGVQFLRWHVAGNACDYCRALDGKIAGINGYFVNKDDSLQPDGGGQAFIPSRNIGHGPLHKACKCYVAPA